VYTTSTPLITSATDKVSFAITAYDRYTGSTNKNGIYQAVLYEDDQPVSGFQIDSISYDETRYLNAHIDYKLRNGGGSYVQHLGPLPGYQEGIYKEPGGDGVITIEDDNVHGIKIEVKDADGNTSVLKFDIKRGVANQPAFKAYPALNYQQKNFNPVFSTFLKIAILVFTCPKMLYTILLGSPTKNQRLQMDMLFINCIMEMCRCICMFPVKIRNSQTTNPGKMVMHRWWSDRDDYAKANQVSIGNQNDWYEASFRAFGNFQLITDTTPPAVTLLDLEMVSMLLN
jgi:hypothetical protein